MMMGRSRARSGREPLATKGPCEHGVKHRSKCKVCGACPHGRWRSSARSAVGHAICEHGRERSMCKECGGQESASTVVGALSARSAVGHPSASTVVSAIDARSAVGREYASTVVSALGARSARSSERIINQTNIAFLDASISSIHTRRSTTSTRHSTGPSLYRGG